jgi:putative ABC transport system substrate-binding protein
MRRREFLGAIGAATAWPFAARAQRPAMQTIGFLNAEAPPSRLITSFRQNLAEAGHVEGRNLTTVYRFAEGKYDLLPGMAAELVQRQVAVIVASPPPAALAAKTATSSVPIVFNVPDDPIKLGLVAAFSRPGGNATGGSFLLSELGAK